MLRLRVCEELGPEPGGANRDWTSVPKPEVRMVGKGNYINTAFSLTAEKELMNQQSIPAHFVALNGSKLNINLKTGAEVRVLGVCGGVLGSHSSQIPEWCTSSSSCGCFSHLT